MTKFQPYKGCNCGWCRGSKQILSNRSNKIREAKQRAHRKFRRTGKNIDLSYEMPTFLSTERWY